jgi:arsenite methyltransferase
VCSQPPLPSWWQLEVLQHSDIEVDVDLFNSPSSPSLGSSTHAHRFVKGLIECLPEAGIEPESIDVCISNCVVNLSPDKEAVLRGVYASLKWGGEFHFSDVFADRRLPAAARTHPVLVGECLGGALYEEDFYRMCHRVGFQDVREMTRSTVKVDDPALSALVAGAQFYSITYRLFKVTDLETCGENYGHSATYKGGITGQDACYRLDRFFAFQKGECCFIDGNTACMLAQSWLRPFFTLTGDRRYACELHQCSVVKCC